MWNNVLWKKPEGCGSRNSSVKDGRPTSKQVGEAGTQLPHTPWPQLRDPVRREPESRSFFLRSEGFEPHLTHPQLLGPAPERWAPETPSFENIRGHVRDIHRVLSGIWEKSWQLGLTCPRARRGSGSREKSPEGEAPRLCAEKAHLLILERQPEGQVADLMRIWRPLGALYGRNQGAAFASSALRKPASAIFLFLFNSRLFFFLSLFFFPFSRPGGGHRCILILPPSRAPASLRGEFLHATGAQVLVSGVWVFAAAAQGLPLVRLVLIGGWGLHSWAPRACNKRRDRA